MARRTHVAFFIFIVFLLVIITSHHNKGNRQDESIILAGIDLHTIGIRQAEAFLGDFADFFQPTLPSAPRYS